MRTVLLEANQHCIMKFPKVSVKQYTFSGAVVSIRVSKMIRFAFFEFVNYTSSDWLKKTGHLFTQ